jgi:hypothetical protein
VLGQIDGIGVDEIQYAKGHKNLTLVYQILWNPRSPSPAAGGLLRDLPEVIDSLI